VMMQLCNSVSSAVDVEGFGQTGPYVKRGGFDNIAIAIGGLMNITGPEVYLSQYNKHGCSLRNYCAGITDKQVNFTVLPLDVRYASMLARHVAVSVCLPVSRGCCIQSPNDYVVIATW